MTTTEDPIVRARELRKVRQLFKINRGAGILFPSFIKSTPCTTRTNSFLEKTPHGVVRRYVRFTIVE